ncbi:hypothetical protein [Streptomyces blattellae]|uniref:hypothetical protein n=1 Tax=Streptomyces blattellae TaxID=2569855 RepID=UPI0012B6EE4F|nr:hypothetical protein [Streptomyces blattellae]
MLEKIRRASVLAAIPAALAIAAATPASADDLSAQSVIGTAYEGQSYTGRSDVLLSDAAPCTDIPAIAGAHSATNNAGSGYVITFYTDLACEVVVGILNPGQSEPGGLSLMGAFGAVAYTVTPV